MINTDPFKEFEEPFVINHADLGNGWHKITTEGVRPPTPWLTESGELAEEVNDVIDMARDHFWGVDKREALNGLESVVSKFCEIHADELTQAALAHDLNGEAGIDFISPSIRLDAPHAWPVETKVADMVRLHAQWTNIIEGRDANEGIRLRSRP